jgi:chemotaxis protein methyltransferase CheR
VPDDDRCVEFLQWALPRLGLRWAGFRKVRRQVCRRVARRVAALDLEGGLPDYRAYLETHPEEWAVLETLTPVTISRFARDRAIFDTLTRTVVPVLERAARADGRERLVAWSAGCASGEEAYTLALMWPSMDVLATDVHPAVLERARRAAYPDSSLRELTPRERSTAFVRRDDEHVVRREHAARVTVAHHDLRDPPPRRPFDLVLCRNAAFTYFAPEQQRAVLAHMAAALRPGGALVVGLHEALPEPATPFAPWPGTRAVHRRA